MQESKSFYINIDEIHPSQLYLNERKLSFFTRLYENGIKAFDSIAVKKIDNQIYFLDGHTRAFVLYQKKQKEIKVHWETEEWDWDIYKKCITLCKENNIRHIHDLKNRTLSDDEYTVKWIDFCSSL